MARPLAAIMTALVVALALVVGIAIFDAVGGVTQSPDPGGRVNAAPLLNGPDNWILIGAASGKGTNETVKNSRGYALKFTGASDSELSSNAQITALQTANWTVAQGAWVDSDATGENMTVLAVGDPTLVLEYRGNQTNATWSAFIYAETESYRINVSAPDPTNASVIYVVRNGSTATIYRNTTAGENVTIGTDSLASGDLSAAGNFDGRLDETRVWNTSLSSSTRSDLVNNPVTPTKPATQRQARIMYDGGGDGVRVYWNSGSASASNATYVSGFAGAVMDQDTGLLDSGDYAWRTEGPEIRPTDGGKLEFAPVAFVEYTSHPIHERVISDAAGAFDLGALLPLILIAGALLAIVAKFR